MNNQFGMNPIARGPQFVLVAVLVGIVLSVAIFDGAQGVTKDAFLKADPTIGRLLGGQYQRDVDAHFEVKSRAMRSVRPYWNEVMLEYFLETPSKITAGYDDFLFYTASLKHGKRSRKVKRPMRDLRLMRMLAGPRVRTVVLIMPAKWRLYPEMLRAESFTEEHLDTYESARAKMIKLGCEAPDVLAALRAEKARHPERLLYPPTDSHMTQWGFHRLVEMFAPEVFREEPSMVRARLGEIEVDPDFEYLGEFIKMLEIRPDSALGQERLFSEPAYLAPALEPGRAEILLLGDSFINVHEQLLSRLLQVAAGTKIDRSASTPLGAERLDLAKEALAPYKDAPPILIVAVYSERRF